MSIVHVILAWLTIAANVGIAAAALARAPFVVANSAAVDVPASWLPVLGMLKLAGSAGVLLGLLGVPVIGTLAAAGLMLLYLGAIGAHVRAHAYSTMAAPALFLALPVATLLTGA